MAVFELEISFFKLAKSKIETPHCLSHQNEIAITYFSSKATL
jgi:hypothetical protein